MNHFPLKATLACLLITPVLYISGIGLSQTYFKSYFQQRISNIVVGNTTALLDGRILLEKQVARNIHMFLKNSRMIRITRIDLNVTVTTSNGRYIYPTYAGSNPLADTFAKPTDMEQVAKQNFERLNQGLHVQVAVLVGHTSILAGMILLGCIVFSSGCFFVFYRIGSRRAEHERITHQTIMEEQRQQASELKDDLALLEDDRKDLKQRVSDLKEQHGQEKKKLINNEEELFDEIVALESQLKEFEDEQEEKQAQIQDLEEKLKKYERRKSSKNKRGDFDFILKRFSVLYKNITMNRRAVSGLMSLTEDLQIKAEELILTLNQTPDQVTIKRKVFIGKKNKTNCFEVLFAYNGRLYFQRSDNSRIDVLVIGTKNTQTKDMEYLHKL